jgi:hypothetical protein
LGNFVKLMEAIIAYHKVETISQGGRKWVSMAKL